MQITPFVCCSDLARTIGFYRDTLEFTLGFRAENYAYMRRDDVAVRLIEVEQDVDTTAQQNSFYTDVKGLDALYQKMKPALDAVPEGRVCSPFNQDDGPREFHVLDPDATQVCFDEVTIA